MKNTKKILEFVKNFKEPTIIGGDFNLDIKTKSVEMFEENGFLNLIKKFKIEGIVTGAVESVYQSSRVQKICNELKIECFNPLWQKDQIEIQREQVKNQLELGLQQNKLKVNSEEV